MNAPIHLPQDLWKVGVRASDVPVVPGSTPNPLAVDEFETFDDDARLEREIGERFSEDYFEMDF